MVMLLQKNVPVNSLCQMCRSGEETVEHILCRCTLATQYWQRVIPMISFNSNISFINGEEEFWKCVTRRSEQRWPLFVDFYEKLEMSLFGTGIILG